MLITSPSYIPYPSVVGFDLTQYNPHKVLRQFGFDQDVSDINATGCPLSDAMKLLIHSTVLEYWASKVERVLVPSRHREGYATSNMKLYWRRVMSTFVDYVSSREVDQVVISPSLRKPSTNARLIPNARPASTWATRQNLRFVEWRADLNGWVVHGGDVPLEWGEKNVIVRGHRLIQPLVPQRDLVANHLLLKTSPKG